MSAYDDAAEIYRMGSLWPIPVLGSKHKPVKGATGYEGTVTDEKVALWLDPNPVVRARAGRGSVLNNIGIRHDLTLAIDVDEGYGTKNGVAQLAAYAEKKGLPPLPGTWSSTARGADTGSRQYVFSIPENVKMKTKPCPSVEVCNWHHRFTTCAPSVHPRIGTTYTWYLPGEPGVPPAWGEATTRYPRRDFFTPLPEAWFKAFQGGMVNADRSADTVELPELVATFRQGEPDGLVRWAMNKWSSEHVGHDEFKNAMIHALMLGRQGHTGVSELVELLIERFSTYVRDARPDVAETELHGSNGQPGLIEFCVQIAQQKPLPPPVQPGQAPTAAQFMAGMVAPPRLTIIRLPASEPAALDSVDSANSVEPIGLATDEEVAHLFDVYTRCVAPERLDRRVTWAMDDGAHRLPVHAARLIEDAISGLYPATAAYHGLLAAFRSHNLPEGDAQTAFAVALGNVLTSRMAAT